MTVAHPNAIPTLMRAVEAMILGPGTPAELAAQLGRIIDDGFVKLQVNFVPDSGGAFDYGSAIKSAQGEQASLLELKGPSGLTVDDLEQAFDQPFRPSVRLHWDSPHRVLTDIRDDDLPCGIRIIAELAPGEPAKQGRGPVAAVTVMRDQKL